MHSCPKGTDCGGCQMYGGPFVCRCLKVTEDDLISAITTLEIRSLRDVRSATGAGDGCTACHRKIQSFIDSYAVMPSPMVSAR
jgi:bacterioferritin-associated ferredoxin